MNFVLKNLGIYCLLVISSFFFIYFNNLDLNSHEFMRIIEQNILNCDSWTCAREAQMSGQYKGYLFLRFSVHKLVSLFGFSNNLQSA